MEATLAVAAVAVTSSLPFWFFVQLIATGQRAELLTMDAPGGNFKHEIMQPQFTISLLILLASQHKYLVFRIFCHRRGGGVASSSFGDGSEVCPSSYLKMERKIGGLRRAS